MKEIGMKILGEAIELSNDYLDIYTLKFLKDNPRVYACTHGEPGFDDRTEEEQQDIIYKKLLKEPSVKNLEPDIKRHGGLIEPILVRHDTREVIEGNSRLAVYRQLHEKDRTGDWELIPCEIVSSLTEEQQAAFLNQIHVKGKTSWSAYEKANFAYVRQQRNWSINQIAELFGESQTTIRIRIKVIEMMKENNDNVRSHFSYYDVLIRTQEISQAMGEEGLGEILLTKIKSFGPNDKDGEFTALELRKKLPVILKKPKVLKKYMDEKIDLDEAYQRAKVSQVEEKVRQAKDVLGDVSQQDVSRLEHGRFNAFKQDVRKLKQEVERLENMIETIGAR